MAYAPLELTDIMPFGKYKGLRVATLINSDVRYLGWVLNNTSLEVYQEVTDIIDIKKENPDFEVSDPKQELTMDEVKTFLRKAKNGTYHLKKGNEAHEYISTRKVSIPKPSKQDPERYIYTLWGKMFAKWLKKNHPKKAKKLGL